MKIRKLLNQLIENRISEGYDDVGIEYIKTKPKLSSYRPIKKIKFKNFIICQLDIDKGPYSPLIDIMAFDATDETEVARCSAFREDAESDKIVCAVDVRPDVRRQGIASRMYEFVEKITGKVVYPEKHHSAFANKFWNQQNRKFGPKDISGRANIKPQK